MDEQRKVIEGNIKLSKETGIPLIATNDVHYINKRDSESHDVLMCIQTGKTIDDPNRRRYPSDQFYLKSPRANVGYVFTYSRGFRKYNKNCGRM